MSESGRYWVIDAVSGRRFCVEPMRERNSPIDGDWKKGNQPAKGGAIKADESIITEDNGFAEIVTLRPGESPGEAITRRLSCAS